MDDIEQINIRFMWSRKDKRSYFHPQRSQGCLTPQKLDGKYSAVSSYLKIEPGPRIIGNSSFPLNDGEVLRIHQYFV